LLIAFLFQVLSQKERFAFSGLRSLWCFYGVLSAVVSCITGFLLFRSGDYDPTLVSLHMWVALALTFVSFALFARSAFGNPAAVFDRTGKQLGIALLVLVVVAGHLGVLSPMAPII